MHFVSKETHLLCIVLVNYHPNMTEILLSGMSTFILKTIFHVLFRLKIKINHINISIHVQKTKFHMRVYKFIAVRNQIIGCVRVFPLSYLCGRGLVSVTSSRTSPIKSDHWIT